MKKAQNLNISHKMFASYLENKSLVRKTDRTLEITSDVANSVLIHQPIYNEVNILAADMVSAFLLSDGIQNVSLTDLNVIYNGYNDASVEEIIERFGSKVNFNVGYCTDDDKEFLKSVKAYRKLLEHLRQQELTIEEYNDELPQNHKIYLLSHRYK